MRMAFDTLLQSAITAEIAKRNGGLERYRYECLCCGEEVYLAAPFSTKMVAHFRHRNGNNNIECENYLGQFSIFRNDNSSRKSSRERVEFYFDFENKVFCIGLKFSEKEILSYQEQGISFEIRTMPSATPFQTIKVNTLNFTPEVPTLIPLSSFSFSYYLSNTGNGARKKYDLFDDNKPAFFKMPGNNDKNKAKMVRGTVIYTDINYFVIFPEQAAPITYDDDIEIIENTSFKTMARDFRCIRLRVLKETPQTAGLINTWGYKLETAETFSLLWPPASMNGEVTEIEGDFAYIYTSFPLQAHGNINLHSEDIESLATGVSKIAVKKSTKIFKKNTEIIIKSINRPVLPFETISVVQERVKEFIVPENNSYFIFNSSGATALYAGQRIILTNQCIVKHFNAGYLIKVILPLIQHELNGEELLTDILKHCKITEKYHAGCFDSLSLSATISEYLLQCSTTGSINSVVKQYILEGKL